MPDYRIGRLRGKLCLVYWRDGKRYRYTLGTDDARQAELIAPSLYAELTRPRGTDVKSLWDAYLRDKADRAVTVTMRYTWKALDARFGRLAGDAVTTADCRAHTTCRRDSGIRDGTIHTELGHLRTVLKWAEKHSLIPKASYIERPAKPKPSAKHLTRLQAQSLRASATVPHVKLFIILAQTTGARNAALLDLTWERIDFSSGLIDLRNPLMTQPHKGRAIVPMNRDARAALLEAREGALSEYVIEWAGKKVKSVKRGLRQAAKAAGLGHVNPHMLRHTAAVHMVEDGIPMEEVAQFLGHSDMRVTRDVYARFSPTHLRRAAEALEYGDLARRKA